MDNRILPDMSEQELLDELRRKAPRIDFSYSAYHEELFRRSQDRHATTMAKWTKWIGIATVVNVFAALVSAGAVVYQILR